jgi:outer membrane protein TolC
MLLLAAPSSAHQADTLPAEPESGTLAHYLREAIKLSPAADEAAHRREAAEARADLAGALPDPAVTYGHYFQEVETRVGPQVARFGVRQVIPLFGKRGLARDIAESRAEAESARYTAATLDVEVDVTRAYAEYAYVTRAREIVAERLMFLRSLEEVVRRMYSDGERSYGDLMDARIALARMEDALASSSARIAVASARLAAAVGLPDDVHLPLADSMPDVGRIEEEDALRLFERMSPDLRMLDAEVEAAGKARTLAGRAYLPDLTLGVDYVRTDEAAAPVRGSGDDPIIGMATISLPLWLGKNRAGVRAAEAELAAAERRRDQRAGELVADLRLALFELADARRRVELYSERIIPAAEQSLDSTQTAYAAGGADFRSVVDGHDEVLESRLALERARADVLIWSAEVTRRAGGMDLGHEAEQ